MFQEIPPLMSVGFQVEQQHPNSLEDRSILLMAGELQKYSNHRIPVQKKIQEGRINLTFRIIT
jgi:hypothetical protein